MTADHRSVHWDPVAGTNHDSLSGKNGARGDFDNLAISQQAGGLRQQVQHVLDGTPSAAYCQPFKDFGCQYKCGNHQRRKELPDSQCGDKCNRHGKLHRHAALDNVLKSLLEDGVAADYRCRKTDHAHPMKRFPKVEPHRRRCQRHKSYTKQVDDFKTMFVTVLIVRMNFAGWASGRSLCFRNAGRNRVRLMDNAHHVSNLLIEISLYNRHQLVGSFQLRRAGYLFRI